MITQDQAQELYERLSDMIGIINEEAQHAYFCANWLRIDNGFEKLCSRRCPAHAETTVPHCLIDEARNLVANIEGNAKPFVSLVGEQVRITAKFGHGDAFKGECIEHTPKRFHVKCAAGDIMAGLDLWTIERVERCDPPNALDYDYDVYISDESQPTGSCEMCGANIYIDDVNGICDQCEWSVEASNGRAEP